MMPERVAVHQIIVGKKEGDNEEERKVIEPGTRFNTEEYGIDEETLKQYDERGVTREVRDQNVRAPGEMTPREESERGLVTEGRSEEPKEPAEREPEHVTTRRTTTRRMEDL
jgi:hypothetical protein